MEASSASSALLQNDFLNNYNNQDWYKPYTWKILRCDINEDIIKEFLASLEEAKNFVVVNRKIYWLRPFG